MPGEDAEIAGEMPLGWRNQSSQACDEGQRFQLHGRGADLGSCVKVEPVSLAAQLALGDGAVVRGEPRCG